MDCVTPNVTIPEAFEGWDKGINFTENRRRRSLEIFDHPLPNKQEPIMHDENHLVQRYRRSVREEADRTLIAGDEKLDVFLGMKLDGVQSYTNLSDTKDMLDYGKFTYFSQEPKITVVEFEPFRPYSEAEIRIKVNIYILAHFWTYI